MSTHHQRRPGDPNPVTGAPDRTIYGLPDDTCWLWCPERSEWQQTPPGTAGEWLPWVEAEAAGIPRQYPEPESAAWDAWTLQQRYRRIIGQVYEGRIISASRMDDLLDDLRSAEAGVEPERRGWLIPNVLAERSNLVVLGDDKATKSTEMHELAITVTTGTPHWGLAPFAWQGDPARVVLVQEENDTEVVFQDLEDISVARGLPPDTPTRLREGGHLRVISKPRLNLLNLTARAFICHLAESADYLFLDSLDKMGVPETNATGELSDTLGYLTQLQAELGTSSSWPGRSPRGCASTSTLRSGATSCLGGGRVRSHSPGTSGRGRDVCKPAHSDPGSVGISSNWSGAGWAYGG